MKIGPFAFEKPIAMLHAPGSAAIDRDGLIGLSALRLLNLTTQLSSRSVWARPSGVARPPQGYPMSGLWLDGEGTRVMIADVGTGSPAAAAGLRVGDAVVGWELRRLIGAITGPAGTQVPMTIERGGKRQDVVVTLAPYL